MMIILAITMGFAGVVQAGSPGLSKKTVFAFPNPALEHSTLRFEAPPEFIRAEATLYGMDGRIVRKWTDVQFLTPRPGIRHARWDLTNTVGSRVSPGIYFWALTVTFVDGRASRVIKKVAVIR